MLRDAFTVSRKERIEVIDGDVFCFAGERDAIKMAPGHFCGAIKCTNSSKKHPEKHFFRVPKDPERCRKWVQNSRRHDLLNKSPEYCYNNIRFCSDHFEKVMFQNDRCERLNWNAFPTLFDVPNPPLTATPRRQLVERIPLPVQPSPRVKAKTQETLSYIEKCKAEIRKRREERSSELVIKFKRSVRAKNRAILRLQKRLKDADTRKQTVASVLESVKDKLSHDMFGLLQNQLENSLVKKHVYRYNDTFKQLALSMCFKSPACYKLVAKALKLPPKKSVYRWLSHIKFHEGFDDGVFQLLKDRGQSMPPDCCVVTLLVDEISLRENVTYNSGEDKVIGVKRNSVGEIEKILSHLVRG